MTDQTLELYRHLVVGERLCQGPKEIIHDNHFFCGYVFLLLSLVFVVCVIFLPAVCDALLFYVHCFCNKDLQFDLG